MYSYYSHTGYMYTKFPNFTFCYHCHLPSFHLSISGNTLPRVGLRDWLSWVTDVTTLQSDWTGLLFSCRRYFFHIYSPLLTFFLCFIVLFPSCCSHARVFGKTLLHEFLISYSHTEWNLLSSGTNTLLWWRACYQKLNYKLKQTLPRPSVNQCENARVAYTFIQ